MYLLESGIKWRGNVGTNIKGDSNPNDKYVLSERAL